MVTNIDQLKTDVDEIKKSLDVLKDNIYISDNERSIQIESIKFHAETTRKKIQSEIDSLAGKIDKESKKKMEKAKALMKSFNETIVLYASVLNSPSSKDESSEDNKEKEGILSGVKQWIGKQRNEISRENLEKKPGETMLRVSGFALTGVGALVLSYKGAKKIWNWAFGKKKKEEGGEDDETETKPKKKKEEDGEDDETENKSKKKEKKKKSSWLKKSLSWAGGILGAGTLGTWAYRNWNFLKGKVNDILGNNLSFEDALGKAKSDILNKAEESGISHNVGFKFHEDTSELETFNNRVKIDRSRKRIEGLDIDFPNYEELLVAAVLVNYMKFSYRGLGANSSPFHVYSNIKGGDIGINLATGSEDAVSGSGTTGKIVGGAAGSMLSLIAGIYGKGIKAGLTVAGVAIPTGVMVGDYIDGQNTLHEICPTLDSQKAKIQFSNYLNELGCWKKGNQDTSDVPDSPIKKEILEIIKEIEETEPDDWKNDNNGVERDLKAIQDKDDPSKFIIESYQLRLPVTVNEKSKTMKIDGLDMIFSLKEGIRVANFTNMMKKKYGGNCGDNDKPFSYKGSVITLGHPGIYVSTSSWGVPICVLSQDVIDTRYPMLKPKIESHYLKYINGIKDPESGLPYWVEK